MRAIDADALRKNMEFICMGVMAGTENFNAPLLEIDNAPTINPEPHWILCSDRLPEIGEYVLCMIRQRYKGQFHVCHYVDKDKYISHPYFDWRHNGFPDVVAWMPLPEPFKG